MGSQADAITDSQVTRADHLAFTAMQNSARRFNIALGIDWNCGHKRTPENTHRIGNQAVCKVCRRRRWMRGFRHVVAQAGLRDDLHTLRVGTGVATGEVLKERQRQLIEELAIRPANGRYPLDYLKRHVADTFGIKVADLIGKFRSKTHIHARCVIIKILHERGLSYPTIGRLLGGRDHSTTINAVEKFPIYRAKDSRVEAAYLELKDS